MSLIAELKSISSTSRSFRLPDRYRPVRRHWIAGIACASILTIAAFWIAEQRASQPEIRVSATDQAISTQIVDGRQRILILNARGPQDARSVIGRLNRPWEPKPSTMIVDANRRHIAEAVWESIQRLPLQQIIVAGAPGDDPAWTTIDRHCRDHNIDLRFLDNQTTIRLESLQLMIHPPDDGSGFGGGFVDISSGPLVVTIAMSGVPVHGRRHVIVGDRLPAESAWSDLSVVGESDFSELRARRMVLPVGDRIDIDVGIDQIRIEGELPTLVNQN